MGSEIIKNFQNSARILEWTNLDFIHSIVEIHAQRNPDKCAVHFEDESLSYRELNQKANALACWLVNRGVGPGVLVGLFMERSLDLVVAIVGTLKAGGAFVPFVKEYPQERIAHMMNDSNLKVILTQSLFSKRLEEFPVEVLAIDEDEELLTSDASESVDIPLNGSDPAYCIYTSGSTGLPKGVLIPHSALINYLRGIQQRFALDEHQNMAMISTVAADLGHTTLFGSLFCGSTLHLISSDRAMDGDAFGDYAAKHPIDVLKIVPSHLKALLQSENPAHVLPNQKLVLGGEATHWELIHRIRQLKPSCRIFNHYGPTETTVGVLTSEVSQPVSMYPTTIPTGLPLPNVYIHILDENLQAVPTGTPGELYIGGRCLAIGYRNQPDLTAERFIQDPFKPGNRIYKTGDRVIKYADGTIHYQGRLDHQLKIRGFRVELGEIEEQIRRSADVAEAVVLADEEYPEKPLIAYIVPLRREVLHSSATQTAYMNSVRDHIKAVLPDYMLPAHFQLLSELPLTPNGKLDRHALSKPDTLPRQRGMVDPTTNTEMYLISLWSEVLSIGAISVTDNFFDLGGHSLLAIEAVSKIRKNLGIRIRLTDFFGQRCLSDLARFIDSQKSENSSAPIISKIGKPKPGATRAGGNTSKITASTEEKFFYSVNKNSPPSQVVSRIKGPVDLPALEFALHKLVENHEILRTYFLSDGTRIIRSVVDADKYSFFKHIDAPSSKEEEIEIILNNIGVSDLQLDANRPPLFRATVIRFGNNDIALIITCHHILIDAIGKSLILEEISRLYGHITAGRISEVSAYTSTYSDYVLWQQENLNSEQWSELTGYWKNRFRNLPKPLEIDAQRDLPPEEQFWQLVPVDIPTDLFEKVQTWRRETRSTLYMVLLATWMLVLAHHSRRDDVITLCPLSTRKESRFHRTIGCFVNLLPFRSRISWNKSFSEHVQELRHEFLEDYDNADFPILNLCRLATENGHSAELFFQAILTLANEVTRLQLPGCQVEYRTELLKRPLGDGGNRSLIDCSFWESSQGLYGVLGYNPQFIPKDMGEKMPRDFVECLRMAMQDPEAELSRLAQSMTPA